MGWFDDHVAIMGDWMPLSPSPRALFSSVIGDDASSRPVAEPSSDNHSGFSFPAPLANHASTGSDQKDGSRIGATVDQTGKFGSLSDQKMSNRRGLVERMAARAGFNAPRLNTESIRPAHLSQSLEVRSPYLTIPPGLSPTTLLDSPVFLSNSMEQSSPTTGKFGFLASGSGRNAAMAEFHDKSKENFYENLNSGSFAFKPIPDSGPPPQFGTSRRVTSTGFPQLSFPSMEVSVQPANTFPSRTVEHPKAGAVNQQADFSRASSAKDSGRCDISSEPGPFHNVGGGAEHSPPFDLQHHEDADQRGGGDPNMGGAPAEDGYNWRKYGQKQVKGSEYPRSYYKCTHPNCPVKKKVERSQEGHITEIIYKGAHNHPKPAPNRRSAIGSLNTLGDMQLENGEQAGTGAADGDPDWATMSKGNGALDWRPENLEVTSSGALGPEYRNGISSLQAQNGSQFESGDAVDGSSTFSNDEDDEDHGTHNSVSLGYDGEGDESESKRRKVETYATDISGASRAIREPRVVVQTTSEVDILDDGYRWRKYGQKVVKGNPNPRSYYKCTSAGCTVRKHVERASHDLKSVITTYEGKHNHDVPAARNSSHVNSGISGNLPVQATADVQSHVHRPEPSQLHSTMAQFERPPFGSFALPGRPPLGPTTQGFGFGMNQQGLSGLAMAALGGPRQGKLHVLPVHAYIGQQRPMNDMGLMRPNGEPKLEPMSDPGLNLSNGSSLYHQVLDRLPLGPQM